MDNFKIRFIKNLKTFYKSNEKLKLLDIGCREGDYSIVAIREGFEVISVDINSQTTLKNFVLADIRKLPFKDRCFDCIIAFDVIEHVAETHYALSECRRVIKDKGKIVISVPNNDLLVRIYFKVTKRIPLSTDKAHKVVYTHRQWQKIIRSVFQIEGIYYQITTEGERLRKIKYFINTIIGSLFKFGSNTFFLCKKLDREE